MLDQVLQQPWWLQAWIFWLVVVNTAAVVFWRRIEARWVLLAWTLNLPLITLLYERFGYTRILGLSHILCWTPLLVYLWRRRPWPGGAYGKWLATLFVTNLASLAIDYLDVVRYLLGERG